MAQDATRLAATSTPPLAPSASPSPSPRPPPSSQQPPTASVVSSSSFQFPHYYNFPPMFTLQPNLNTRRAQLDKWAALVLAYCRHYRIFRLVVGGQAGSSADRDGAAAAAAGPVRVGGGEEEAGRENGGGDDDDGAAAPSASYYAPDLFRNRQIDRAMPPAEVREVLEDLRRQGRVEPVDDDGAAAAASKTSPDTLAVYVYWQTPEEWAAAVEAFVDDTAQRGSVLTLYELTMGDATRGSALHGLDPAVLQRALAVLVRRGKAQVFGAEESLGVKFF